MPLPAKTGHLDLSLCRGNIRFGIANKPWAFIRPRLSNEHDHDNNQEQYSPHDSLTQNVSIYLDYRNVLAFESQTGLPIAPLNASPGHQLAS